MKRSRPLCTFPTAFTLVEMLLVVTIIAILAAVAFPAITAVMESIRIASCGNNLKNVGNGMRGHDAQLASLPCTGWGIYWTGDPNRGAHQSQPGSWFYQILPYIDQKQTWEMGLGYEDDAVKLKNRLAKMNAVFLEIAYCPTRRDAAPYPNQADNNIPGNTPTSLSGLNFGASPLIAKTDYAACTGNAQPAYDPGEIFFPRGPAEESAEEYCPPGRWTEECKLAVAMAPGGDLWATSEVSGGQAYYDYINNGAILWLGRTSIASISELDGASRTILVGEKFIADNEAASLACFEDNHCVYQGFTSSNVRQTLIHPRNDNDYATVTNGQADPYPYQGVKAVTLPDTLLNAMVPAPPKDDVNDEATENLRCANPFGAAHTVGCNFLLGDGSVHFIPYLVDLRAYQSLGSRNGTKEWRTTIKVEKGDDGNEEEPYLEQKMNLQEIKDTAG